MPEPTNEITAMLRNYAVKLAGAPDRLTTADGQGGITTSKQEAKKDPGEADLKADLPTNAPARTTDKPASPPDRLTTADGQGGITAAHQEPKKDPGETDVKKDMPANASVRKSASNRVANIRAALQGANPALGFQEQSKEAAPIAQPMPGTGAGENFEMSQDLLAKIASAALSTEEGAAFIHGLLEKQAGAAVARERMMEAIEAADVYDAVGQVKSAAVDDVFSKAAAIYEDLSQSITEEDADGILKTAAIHQSALIELEHPMLKQAYAAGMDDAALMEAADESQGEEGVPPTDEALPMGGEQLGEEEILSLLQEMIASGEITEEDIMQAVSASEGGEGGEGLPPEAAPAAGM
jgi:hypothetical protein